MKEINLIELWQAVLEKRKSIFIWAIVSIVISVVISLSLPRYYASTIKVVPENQTGSQSMSNSMGALAGIMGVNIGSGVKSGITSALYPQIINSAPFLADMSNVIVPYQGSDITLYDYLNDCQKSPWWSVVLGLPGDLIGAISKSTTSVPDEDNRFKTIRPTIEQLQFERILTGCIDFKEDSKSSIISITVAMQDPAIAAIVADSVVSRLQYYMTKYYTSKARYELQMNEKLLDQARQRYFFADSLYALSVDRNQNLISQYAQIKVERLENEKTSAFSIYNKLQSQVEMSKIKVQEDTPIVTVIESAREPLIPSSPNRKKIVLLFLFASVFIRVLIIAIKKTLKKKRDINL